MLRFYCVFVALLMLFSSANVMYGEPAPPQHASTQKYGYGAGYSSRDATILSMMGWGTILVVGIALLCGSLSQSTTSTTHAH